MKNITISIDEKVARWAKVEAAKARMSLSRFLSRLLESKMESEASYDSAMRKFLDTKPFLNSKGKSYPKRDELYE